MKTNPVMEFAIYQSVKFANSAPVALIGGILRFGTYNIGYSFFIRRHELRTNCTKGIGRNNIKYILSFLPDHLKK